MRKGDKVKIKEYRVGGQQWPHLIGLTGVVAEHDGPRSVWVSLDGYMTEALCLKKDLEVLEAK